MTHYIDNSWIPGSGEIFRSKDPGTGEELWKGTLATKTEVEMAVEAAEVAFLKWRTFSFEERASHLHRFAKELDSKKDLLAEVISQETGKPLWESLTEVVAMKNKVAISVASYKERCAERKREVAGKTLITHHKPHGVVAVIGPFNFPGHLPNGHSVPALLAGNTVIFKSSSYTPKVAEVTTQCWERAELPKGVFNLLQGGHKAGSYLATHPSVSGLFFTGSYATGELLMEELADHPEKILALEMGGNNPLVISSFRDPIAVAYLTIQSAFLTAGQRCSCARRLILVENKETAAFLNILEKMIRGTKIGHYRDRPEPFMGPVIDGKSRDRLLEAQAKLGAQGGRSLVEMEGLKSGTPFLSPGLMDVTEVNSRPDEELFGPFLQVIRVPDFAAAIKEANQTAYGLTAGLVSDHPQEYPLFLEQVRAGVINWNAPLTGASSQAPFGGVGKSGNHHPSAYYAADYCSYPVASMEQAHLHLPESLTPGIELAHAQNL